jgi:hypothetical protein
MSTNGDEFALCGGLSLPLLFCWSAHGGSGALAIHQPPSDGIGGIRTAAALGLSVGAALPPSRRSDGDSRRDLLIDLLLPSGVLLRSA